MPATRNKKTSAKSQQIIEHKPLGSPPGKEANSGRCIIRVISCRTRLLDPDNLCPKYFIDSLRYAGLIKDDSTKEVVLETAQEKVSKKAEEKTIIEMIWGNT